MTFSQIIIPKNIYLMFDILGCYCYNLEWFGNEDLKNNMLFIVYIFFHKCVCH